MMASRVRPKFTNNFFLTQSFGNTFFFLFHLVLLSFRFALEHFCLTKSLMMMTLPTATPTTIVKVCFSLIFFLCSFFATNLWQNGNKAKRHFLWMDCRQMVGEKEREERTNCSKRCQWCMPKMKILLVWKNQQLLFGSRFDARRCLRRVYVCLSLCALAVFFRVPFFLFFFFFMLYCCCCCCFCCCYHSCNKLICICLKTDEENLFLLQGKQLLHLVPHAI